MSKEPIASRVHQLDAHFLDEELERLLLNQLEQALTRIHLFNRVLSRVHPELILLLRSFLFRQSVYKFSASPGQKLLQLKLFSQDFSPVTRKQLTLYGILTCALPYLNARFGSTLIHLHSPFETAVNLLRVINSLLFLSNGTYGSIEQRLTRITCAYESHKAAFSVLSTEHVARELLWYSFEEFLTFLLPLINPVKVKNIWTRVFKGQSVVAAHNRLQAQTDICAICHRSPVNARQIGCDHCFCYYCVMSTYLADESHGFSCPECNATVTEKSSIKEMYLKGF